MKVVTPRQMNEIDRFTINEIKIPGIVLMENAALRVVDEIVSSLGSLKGKKIVVLAGKGNNGGDAFAVARHLFNKNADIKVYITAPKADVSGDAAVNLEILSNMNINVTEFTDNARMSELIKDLAFCDMVVDGLLGTGLKGAVRGIIGDVIQAVNDSGKPVVCIDIPSGVNGESGAVTGSCIKGFKTVTFALPKIGLLVHPGCEYTGELIVADIGIPSKAINRMDIKVNTLENSDVSKLLPKRNAQSNKGNFGKVFIVTGSKGMTGAGCLAGGAALKTGSGLVYLGVPASLSLAYDCNVIEAVTVPLEDEGRGYLCSRSIDMIMEKMKNMDALAVGPGLSVNEEVSKVLFEMVENCTVPIVLDADALNIISKNISLLKKLKCPAVITPHPGEMSRLTGRDVNDIQNNRIETAVDFAKNWNVITVLKGARTIIASPDGTVYINMTGNPGMASGGTGDVLTGIIVSLIGQGLSPLEAAAAGAYIHGLAGDRAAKAKGEYGLTAGDLVEELPYTIKHLQTYN